MLTFLQNLFEPKSNPAEAAKLIVDCLKVNITATTLSEEIEEHPNYPSLLSISDVLITHGFDNITISIAPEKLNAEAVPFITPLKDDKSGILFFTVVKEIDQDQFLLYDPNRHKWTKLYKDDFFNRYTGTILLVDSDDLSEATGESEYPKKRKVEIQKQILISFIVLCIPFIVIAMGIATLIETGTSAVLPFIFCLLTLTGGIVGALLIWYELDQYNPALQQICTVGKKVNCSAILHSKASKIAGVSWSCIGFSYFMGQLLLLLLTGITNRRTLIIVSWLNVLALPYVFFSVYYQWKVARQWCILCLCVQAILVLQYVTAAISSFHYPILPSTISIPCGLSIMAALAFPFIAVNVLIPSLEKAKRRKHSQMELQRLKHDPQIFEALLAKQKVIAESTEGLGITLGNPNARYKLIKVCNPYCGPCSRAHKTMEELLENNDDIQIQIIFTASNDDGDIKRPPVRHLLAIAEKEYEARIKKALGDWYLPDNKNYDVFAAKYPMNGELLQQRNKIETMNNWCNKMNIQFTPTFFVSIINPEKEEEQHYYQLPSKYTVNDLKYFLKK